MTAQTESLFVQRAKWRAVEAAEDAIICIHEGRYDDARDLLRESLRVIDTAEQRHKDGAR